MAQNLHREGKSVYEEKKGKKKGLPKGGLSLGKSAQNLHRKGSLFLCKRKERKRRRGCLKEAIDFYILITTQDVKLDKQL
jgi:hypothetical protein